MFGTRTTTPPRRSLRTRRALTALAVPVLALGLVGCEDERPTFVASAAATGPDVTPGDGVCATEGGDCSLQAAVEEANALGGGRIALADGDAYTGDDLEITGRVDLTATSEDGAIVDAHLSVADGGTLAAKGIEARSLDVHGAAVLERVSLVGPDVPPEGGPTPLLSIGPAGRVHAGNIFLFAQLGPAAVNGGTLWLQGATILPQSAGSGTAPVITTGPGAETTLAATSIVADQETVPVCGGATPVSRGYNAVADDSCALTGPGDIEDVAERGVAPETGSVRTDAIPVGELACGEGWDTAIDRGPRPLDGDGDGVEACDIGAWEILYFDPL